jgi:hypothetical protein
MKRELRDRWVAALRSGEYKQGRDQLRTPGGSFCCLGVLAETVGARRDGYRYHFEGDTHSRSLDVPETLVGGLEQSALIDMNDDAEEPFSVIADWIEANVQVED